MVNCAPAKCLCLPDLVPAQAFVRAGNGGGNSECGGWAGWHCGLGKRGYHWFASGIATLAKRCPRFVHDLAVLAGLLPSVCLFGLAVLAGALLSIHAFGLAVLSSRFAFVHACLFSLVRKKETACDVLRSYSAGSRSPFVRSRGVGTIIFLGWFTSGLSVSCRRSRRVTGGRGGRGTELAARPLCVFAQSH